MTAYTMNNEKKAIQELSMEEMDKVVGGGTIVIEGIELTEAEFNDMMLVVCDACGYEVAAEVFLSYTGYPGAMDKTSHSSTDRDRLLVLLAHYWHLVNSGGTRL